MSWFPKWSSRKRSFHRKSVLAHNPACPVPHYCGLILCFGIVFLSAVLVLILFQISLTVTSSIGINSEPVCRNSSQLKPDYLFITIKSTSIYHLSRLKILLQTWIPDALALKTTRGLPVVSGVSTVPIPNQNTVRQYIHRMQWPVYNLASHVF